MCSHFLFEMPGRNCTSTANRSKTLYVRCAEMYPNCLQQGVQNLQKNHFIAKVKEVLLISRPHCDICEGEDASLESVFTASTVSRDFAGNADAIHITTKYRL